MERRPPVTGPAELLLPNDGTVFFRGLNPCPWLTAHQKLGPKFSQTRQSGEKTTPDNPKVCSHYFSFLVFSSSAALDRKMESFRHYRIYVPLISHHWKHMQIYCHCDWSSKPVPVDLLVVKFFLFWQLGLKSWIYSQILQLPGPHGHGAMQFCLLCDILKCEQAWCMSQVSRSSQCNHMFQLGL